MLAGVSLGIPVWRSQHYVFFALYFSQMYLHVGCLMMNIKFANLRSRLKANGNGAQRKSNDSLKLQAIMSRVGWCC